MLVEGTVVAVDGPGLWYAALLLSAICERP